MSRASKVKRISFRLQSFDSSNDYLIVGERNAGTCSLTKLHALGLASKTFGQQNLVTYWSDIVEQHGRDVWRTAYRLLNNAEDASDCYQETFLQAVEYARGHEIACWPAVLRRIATARAMDALRQRYRSSQSSIPLSTLETEPFGNVPSPDVRAQLSECMAELRHALTKLPAVQAEVFLLSEVEFLSHHDIAEQLGATSEQVALWLHRAKHKLRKLLSARGVTNEVKQ